MFEGLFQPTHLLVIFFIALLVFGPKKLPELGKGLGEGLRALKEGMKNDAPPPASTHQSRKTKPTSYPLRRVEDSRAVIPPLCLCFPISVPKYFWAPKSISS